MDALADIPDLDAGEFTRRRRHAQRLGTPAWLWPEVSPAAWKRAVGDIRQAIASILRGEHARLASSDSLAISLACYTAGVGPLLGYWCEARKLSAPTDIAKILNAHLEHARARERRVHKRSRQVVAALTERRIPVIVLKGSDTACRYFEVAEVRPASDLDLLIRFDWIQAVEAVLAHHGLIPVERSTRGTTWANPGDRCEPRSLWLIHADDPWSVDLHSSLDFAASPGAATVKLDRTDPFAGAEPWAIEPQAKVLRQPLLLLHLAAHASGALHNLTLLRMVEIVLVIRKDLAAKRLSWNEFVTVGTQVGGLGAAYPALSMAEMLAPGTVPDSVLGQCLKAMPARARRVVEQLDPSTAHRVDGASIAEHFMWVTGAGGWLRQLRADLLPGVSPLRRIYGARFYRLLRGRISR